MGMIQVVCVREGGGKGGGRKHGPARKTVTYRSLTADRITIHPGSVMFRSDPMYIVAGEIVRTSRMYAMSVSPLSRKIIEKLGLGIEGEKDLSPAPKTHSTRNPSRKGRGGAKNAKGKKRRKPKEREWEYEE
jgi:hypothetical protein